MSVRPTTRSRPSATAAADPDAPSPRCRGRRWPRHLGQPAVAVSGSAWSTDASFRTTTPRWAGARSPTSTGTGRPPTPARASCRCSPRSCTRRAGAAPSSPAPGSTRPRRPQPAPGAHARLGPGRVRQDHPGRRLVRRRAGPPPGCRSTRGTTTPTRFWTYVVAALDCGCTRPEHRRRRPCSRRPASRSTSVVATLINDLETAAPDLVLVLDDYHVIESAEIHDSVAFLLEHLPPQIRLVIATRADPPLPLASLRADGDLLEVRAADLRFTPDEAASYLAGADGPDPHRRPTSTCSRPGPRAGSPRSSSPRCRCRAATTRRRSSPSSPATTGSSSTTSPTRSSNARRPEVRDFLLATSILTRLTGPLCAAVTGRDDAKAILEELERSNLFLVAARRPPHLVPLPPPLRRRPAGPAPRRAARPGARAAPPGERLVRRQRRAPRGHRPRPGRRRPGPGRRADRAGRTRRCSGPARRRSSAAGSSPCPPTLFDDRPVLADTLVGRPHGDRRPDRGRSRCSTCAESLARPRPAPRSSSTRTRTARLPAMVAVHRAGLALLAGDTDGTIAHANRVLDLAGRRRSAAARRSRRAARAGRTGPGATSTPPGTATPSRSAAFEHGGYLADVMGVLARPRRHPARPGPAPAMPSAPSSTRSATPSSTRASGARRTCTSG